MASNNSKKKNGYVLLQESSRLVFVPGMGDAGPGAVLPRPPLPESLTKELRERLPNAVFASNPCRVRHYNQARSGLACASQALVRRLVNANTVQAGSLGRG